MHAYAYEHLIKFKKMCEEYSTFIFMILLCVKFSHTDDITRPSSLCRYFY